MVQKNIKWDQAARHFAFSFVNKIYYVISIHRFINRFNVQMLTVKIIKDTAPFLRSSMMQDTLVKLYKILQQLRIRLILLIPLKFVWPLSV